MMNLIQRVLFLMALSVGCRQSATAQGREVIENYIAAYREIAIAEMQRTGVPAAIKLAQGIHETTAGTSDLVVRSNNHFGIKCKSNWTGESVSHSDDLPNECFRKYNSPEDSYRDHSDFLKNNTRYAALFQLDPEDYKSWAHGLKKAGYATNPKYPLLLIRLIEEYHLQDYSLIALGKMEPGTWASNRRETKPAAEEQNAELTGLQTVELPVVDYPDSEFRINDTRVVYALAGTSLLALAMQYDIPLRRLFEFNELPEQESLAQSQLIYLQRKRKTGDQEFHVVLSGETIYHIAQTRGIRMESLLEYNHLESGMQPAVGARLYLKKKAPGRPPLLQGLAQAP
ncbi:MAG: glucosaminidase domain-containing protein [Chitinophagaceae bacterium]